MTADQVATALVEALEAERLEVTRHFWDELEADAFDFTDVRMAIETIDRVTEQETDRAGYPKFEVSGTATDHRRLAII